MPDLATLTALRRVITQTGETLAATDDDLLRRFIRDASQVLARETGRSFVPEWRTRTFDAEGDHVDSDGRWLDVPDLLAVTTLTNGDGTAYGPTEYVLRPSTGWPKWRVQLRPSAAQFLDADGDPFDAISLAGIWGYHDAYDQAWRATGDTVQDNPLTAGATSLTVLDADGLDAHGELRFPILGYIRIEDELLQVTAANTSTNVLTVWRAQQGSVAASHIKTTAITRWIPVDDLQRACEQLAHFLYRTKDTAVTERVEGLGGAFYTGQAPTFIRETISRYAAARVR